MTELAEIDRRVVLEALVQLRHHLTELARIAYLIEGIGAAAPELEIKYGHLKLEIGRLWQEMELAQASLPFEEVIAGARRTS